MTNLLDSLLLNEAEFDLTKPHTAENLRGMIRWMRSRDTSLGEIMIDDNELVNADGKTVVRFTDASSLKSIYDKIVNAKRNFVKEDLNEALFRQSEKIVSLDHFGSKSEYPEGYRSIVAVIKMFGAKDLAEFPLYCYDADASPVEFKKLLKPTGLRTYPPTVTDLLKVGFKIAKRTTDNMYYTHPDFPDMIVVMQKSQDGIPAVFVRRAKVAPKVDPKADVKESVLLTSLLEPSNSITFEMLEEALNMSKVTVGKVNKADFPELKGDVFTISNKSPVVDALITMLGITRDGVAVKIRTGFMAYDPKNEILFFSLNKYDLPAYLAARPDGWEAKPNK